MADVIRVTGMTFDARHGVHPEEKTEAQPFVVDVAMWVGTDRAARTDALDDTVDYSAVSREISEVVLGPTRNLIETLAEDIASRVLNTYLVERVEVTVHKPLADVGVPVSDVSVTITRNRTMR